MYRIGGGGWFVFNPLNANIIDLHVQTAPIYFSIIRFK